MSIVLDASVAIEWFVKGQHSDAARLVAVRLLEDTAVVPQLWPLEIANVLTLAVRRGKIDPMTRSDALDALAGMSIEVDGETVSRAWADTLVLADNHRLTAYDAAYLELARRRRMPLASLDQELIAAAGAEGLEVLP